MQLVFEEGQHFNLERIDLIVADATNLGPVLIGKVEVVTELGGNHDTDENEAMYVELVRREHAIQRRQPAKERPGESEAARRALAQLSYAL